MLSLIFKSLNSRFAETIYSENNDVIEKNVEYFIIGDDQSSMTFHGSKKSYNIQTRKF